MLKEADWRKSTVCQIYPKSSSGTTGNGIGDVNGIIEKLDYIKLLGADYIWLTPVYKSLVSDNGYGISSYLEVDEDFGTMDDSEGLINVAHEKGIKAMSDIVINHISVEYGWLKAARKSRDNPYRDYYFFKVSEDGPPTNWHSKFGGSVWKYDSKTDEYYLHSLDVSQVDLSWDNPEIRQSLYRIVNHWIDFGVDGF